MGLKCLLKMFSNTEIMLLHHLYLVCRINIRKLVMFIIILSALIFSGLKLSFVEIYPVAIGLNTKMIVVVMSMKRVLKCVLLLGIC